ncbi:hypothetical protein D3C76_782320 [compost metagenome]
MAPDNAVSIDAEATVASVRVMNLRLPNEVRNPRVTPRVIGNLPPGLFEAHIGCRIDRGVVHNVQEAPRDAQ